MACSRDSLDEPQTFIINNIKGVIYFGDRARNLFFRLDEMIPHGGTVTLGKAARTITYTPGRARGGRRGPIRVHATAEKRGQCGWVHATPKLHAESIARNGLEPRSVGGESAAYLCMSGAEHGRHTAGASGIPAKLGHCLAKDLEKSVRLSVGGVMNANTAYCRGTVSSAITLVIE